MARILMTYFSSGGEAMYDAITGFLKDNGNDVFRFNINTIKVHNTRWAGISTITNRKLKEQIKTFNPDIVLNFNNAMPINCHELISEKCKICVIDADTPDIAFWNRDAYFKNRNKYLYIGLQSYSRQMYEDFLCMKLQEGKNYLYMPPATVVQNKKLKQDKNISFIGSIFLELRIPENENFYSNDALHIYNEVKKDYFITPEEIEKQGIHTFNIKQLLQEIRSYYTGQGRLKHLQLLSDLGLKIYGVKWWKKIAFYDFELASCFDPTPIATIEENQWLYNTSKISVNISHPLAKTSFSWRVMDIMASNACLLTEDKPDWRDLFEKYLSKETLDAVIYKDRFDMREKAIKLLSDEKLRKKCVKELNHAIEENGRWIHRFSKLEKFLGTKLIGLKNKNPEYIYIQREEKKIKEEKSDVPSTIQEDPALKRIEKQLSLMNKINLKLSVVPESVKMDYIMEKIKVEQLNRYIIDKFYANRDFQGYKKAVNTIIHQNNKINIAHAYAKNYNFGDNALAYGVKNIFLNYYDKEIHFENIDVHTTNFDVDTINKLNETYDMLLVGGGGLIQADEGKYILFNMKQKEAGMVKIPMLFYGLGYNDGAGMRLHPDIVSNLKFLQAKAKGFTLRNDGSKERLEDFNLYMPEVPDPGFFVDGNHPRPDIDGKYVMVQLANNDKLNRQKDTGFIKQITGVCKYIIDKGYTVILAPHCIADKQVCDKILRQIKSEKLLCWDWYKIMRNDNVSEGLGYYKHAEFVIAMRGQAQICPVGMNVPVISVISHPKHIGLLKKLGLEKYSVEIDDKSLESKIEKLIDNVEKNKKSIKQNLSKIMINLTKETENYIKGLKND